MASILTNHASMGALQTLRSIAGQMQETQQRVSSGLRITSAADNAAYWSIATTMRSDMSAVSAVTDALGLGSATVDTAYAAISSVADILGEFKAKLIAAKQDGIDNAKIQEELSQLKDQVVSIAKSASFNGVNWLETDVANMHDGAINKTYTTSGFIRSVSGIAVSQTTVDLSNIALFNSTGDGLLQADSRDIGSIGGIKRQGTTMDDDGVIHFHPTNTVGGTTPNQTISFNGDLVFSLADSITFDVTVDEDNPADVPPPHHAGETTSITIDRALIDQVLPSNSGVIRSSVEYSSVIQRALSNAGASASSINTRSWIDGRLEIDPVRISLYSPETSGLDGSSIRVSNYQSTLLDTGISDTATSFGPRGSTLTSITRPYEVFMDGENENGVVVSFEFSINRAPARSYQFDRTYVNNLLGVTDGKIQSADDQVTLLKSLLAADWPDLIIETNGNTIILRTDEQQDRLAGSKTRIGFTNISVSIEPIPQQNFIDIDIVTNKQQLDRYIAYLEIVTTNVIGAAATLGSLQTRIGLQEDFANQLQDSTLRGIGRLVDANMNEESTRLKALQTQQQLALQSLSIANSNAETIISLFR